MDAAVTPWSNRAVGLITSSSIIAGCVVLVTLSNAGSIPKGLLRKGRPVSTDISRSYCPCSYPVTCIDAMYLSVCPNTVTAHCGYLRRSFWLCLILEGPLARNPPAGAPAGAEKNNSFLTCGNGIVAPVAICDVVCPSLGRPKIIGPSLRSHVQTGK